MLPEFPQFKSLELADKEEIGKITGKYRPYSDFNFVSMWSWDIKGEMRISVLNGNLVVRFTDYQTGKPFYSFLGNNNVNETVEALFELSKKEGLELKMKLVPEDSVKDLDASKYKIEEDRDNFDYISDNKEVSEFKGTRFAGKRKKYNFFIRNFPNIRTEILDLKNRLVKEDIFKLDQEWLRQKREKNVNYEFNENESVAHDRFFLSEMTNILGIGVFDEEKFIAYSIFEILQNKYSICHFSKADTHYESVYEYLERETDRVLLNRGCNFLNNEQDLGVPGLRKSKQSYVSKYLKKFTLSFANF